MIQELGIMLNNMLGEEDLNPMGFHLWPRQQRLPTMMAPTIVTGQNGVELVLGSGGSNRLRSAILQVIMNFSLKDGPGISRTRSQDPFGRKDTSRRTRKTNGSVTR